MHVCSSSQPNNVDFMLAPRPHAPGLDQCAVSGMEFVEVQGPDMEFGSVDTISRKCRRTPRDGRSAKDRKRGAGSMIIGPLLPVALSISGPYTDTPAVISVRLLV